MNWLNKASLTWVLTWLRSARGPKAKSVQAAFEHSVRATAGLRAATACRLLAISVKCPMYPARRGARSLHSTQSHKSGAHMHLSDLYGLLAASIRCPKPPARRGGSSLRST